MEIIRQLCQESKSEQWWDGVQWLLWTFLTGLLPLWGTMVLLKLFSQPVSASTFLENGEFVLYAASYTGGSIYLVMRDFKTTPFPSRTSLMIMLVGLALASALMFAGIASISLIDQAESTTVARLIDPQFVKLVSWTVFPLAIMFSFAVVIADNIRTNPDPSRIQKRQLEKLGNDFDRLGR